MDRRTEEYARLSRVLTLGQRIASQGVGVIRMPIDTLEALLEESLKDLLDAEKQITKALPKMVKAASSAELKAAFKEHLEQTKGQIARLEEVFGHLGAKVKSKPCAAMKGLLEEGQEQTQEDAEGPFMDLLLIAAAQKMEHYEISGYGSVRAIAEAIGNEEVAELLRQTEEEESETDEKLTEIATVLIEQASEGQDDDDESDTEEDEEIEQEEEEEHPVVVKPAVKKAAVKKR